MRNKLSLVGLLLVGLLLLLGVVAARAQSFVAFDRGFDQFQFQPGFGEFRVEFKGFDQFDGAFARNFVEDSPNFTQFAG